MSRNINKTITNSIITIYQTRPDIDIVALTQSVYKSLHGKITRSKIKEIALDLDNNNIINLSSGSKISKSSNNKKTTREKDKISGTFFRFSENIGGKVIVIGENGKTHTIRVREYPADVQDGGTVTLGLVNNEYVITSSTDKSGDITANGIKINPRNLKAGSIIQDEQSSWFVPFDNSNKIPLLNTPKSEIYKESVNKVITAEILTSRNSKGEMMRYANIQEVFGELGDPLPETNAIASEYGFNNRFSSKALIELSKIPNEVDLENYNIINENQLNLNKKQRFDGKKTYVDLRHKRFVTIDPYDCRDMDDAVYTEVDNNGNFVTYAAIADVTEYVKPGMALWDEAINRGFTLYTPSGAYPMLPEKLSNGICSLNPNCDRLTICMKTVIDKSTGKPLPEKTQIFNAVINSKIKLSYNEVEDCINSMNVSQKFSNLISRKKDEPIIANSLNEQLLLHKVCSDTIWKNYNRRETLRFNMNDETQFELSEDKKNVTRITTKEHLKSMEIIEALMINANEAVAEFCNKNNIHSLYRVHGEPTEKKAEVLYDLLDAINIHYTPGTSNKNLRDILYKVAGTDYEYIVSDLVLRAQNKARYSHNPYPETDNGNMLLTNGKTLCHNALQSPYYTHFTSGIRRGSDIISQYAINSHIQDGIQAFTNGYVAEMGVFLSSREVANVEAERKINDLYLAIWAENHIGEIFDGRIIKFDKSNVIIRSLGNSRIIAPISEIKQTETICNGTMLITNESNSGKHGKSKKDMANEETNIKAMLGDEVNFKITNSNRETRQIFGAICESELTGSLTDENVINKDMEPFCVEDFTNNN